MVSTAEAGEALTLLARFIEQRTGERILEVTGDRDIIDLAAEHCATPVEFCSAIEIGTVLSCLMDRVDWPGARKQACRELLAAMADSDVTSMMRARSRSGRLN